MNAEQRRMHAQTQAAASVAEIEREVDRRLNEHIELIAMVKRLAFLLNSARLLLTRDPLIDDAAYSAVRAATAVHDAEQLLGRIKQ